MVPSQGSGSQQNGLADVIRGIPVAMTPFPQSPYLLSNSSSHFQLATCQNNPDDLRSVVDHRSRSAQFSTIAMKPYQRIVIQESEQPLVELPDDFVRVDPHPYEKLGAPYGDRSPFCLRSGVVKQLYKAQALLQQLKPGWGLQVFDAYRPVAVQQFMVEYTLLEVLHDRGWNSEQITPEQRQAALAQVYQFWAVPNLNPLTPPPHSTGGAIDLTLVDDAGQPVDMGSDIDELSPRSYPDHYVGLPDADAQRYDQHRQLLNYCMSQVGFERHYHEWWHFSYGDQLWAWLRSRRDLGHQYIAQYGRAS